ncbi:uncharacterized protein LOC133285683 [Gastrolobium bilobum]|uniref:uncharacterized protein LOC133285683 n=1 Tax=Gastrolobium bilobum TaxID=150636 RepID=UPI002AAFF2D8|nr:uncharacterized protein LOC133285683 [Gastrolobium bilobum]
MLSSLISPSITPTFINDAHQELVQSIFAEMKSSFAAMNTTCENVIHMLKNLIHERKEQAAIKIQKAFLKYSLKLTIHQSESIDQNELPQTEVEHPIAKSLNNREMFHEFADGSPLDQVACVNVGAYPEIEASLILYASALSSLSSPVINDVIKKPVFGGAIPLPETMTFRTSAT